MKARLALLFLLSLLFVLSACDQEDEWATRKIELNQSLINKHPGRFNYDWEEALDSLDEDIQPIFYPGHGRIRCKIYAKDIILGRDDSLRIGIIQPLEVVFGYPKSSALPDHLILSPYGQDTIPVSLDQSGNVGPVTRSTVFRVNRSFYSLNSLDSTRQHIEITKLKRKPGGPPTVEFNTQFNQIAVRRVEDGKEMVVRQQKGREAIIYFWSLGVQNGQSLLDLSSKLDSLGEAAPQLIAISRADSKDNLQAFIEAHKVKIPLYQNTGSTCSGLECHPLVPYAVMVNTQGRIITHYLRHDDLMEQLGQKRTDVGNDPTPAG